MELPHYVIDFSLCYQNCILNITSTDTFNADEGTSVNHTLIASDDNATFSLIENTSNLFSLTGTTLTFNGTTADFESNTVVFSAILRLPVKVIAVGVSSLRSARLTVMVCSVF
jgi:hypothetical protein